MPAQAARVGILSNAMFVQTAADFTAKIQGHTFTPVDVSASVPPLDTLLANFDVILLFEDTVFVNSTAVGNRVAEFANAGRAVVLGTFYDQDRSDATGGTTRASRLGRAGNDRPEHDRRRRHRLRRAHARAGQRSSRIR